MEHSAAPTSMLDEATELPCAFARTNRIAMYAPHRLAVGAAAEIVGRTARIPSPRRFALR
jgi:hypothetical protein